MIYALLPYQQQGCYAFMPLNIMSRRHKKRHLRFSLFVSLALIGRFFEKYE